MKKLEFIFLRKQTSLELLIPYTLFFLLHLAYQFDLFLIFMVSTAFALVGLYYEQCIEVTEKTKLYSILSTVVTLALIVIWLLLPTWYDDALASIGLQCSLLVESILLFNVLRVYCQPVTFEN